jgi:hypothetical protein
MRRERGKAGAEGPRVRERGRGRVRVRERREVLMQARRRTSDHSNSREPHAVIRGGIEKGVQKKDARKG